MPCKHCGHVELHRRLDYDWCPKCGTLDCPGKGHTWVPEAGQALALPQRPSPGPWKWHRYGDEMILVGAGDNSVMDCNGDPLLLRFCKWKGRDREPSPMVAATRLDPLKHPDMRLIAASWSLLAFAEWCSNLGLATGDEIEKRAKAVLAEALVS